MIIIEMPPAIIMPTIETNQVFDKSKMAAAVPVTGKALDRAIKRKVEQEKIKNPDFKKLRNQMDIQRRIYSNNA